jgi:hypothetical protein
MKVVRVDLAEAVAADTGGHTDMLCPCHCPLNFLLIDLFREAFDLGVLATRDSSLVCLDFAIKVYIPERKQLKKRFPHLHGN